MRWIKLLRWTAVITTLAALLMILAVVMLMRYPSISDLATCQLHMPQIYGAIERYRATHDDKYPESLDMLRKEYMKDPSILKCPLDKSKSDKTSYTYTPPKGEPQDNEILVRCNRHRLKPGFPPIEVYLTVGGMDGFRQDPKSVKTLNLPDQKPEDKEVTR